LKAAKLTSKFLSFVLYSDIKLQALYKATLEIAMRLF